MGISYVNFISSGARRRTRAVATALAVALLTPAASLAAALQYTVPSTTMPWTPSGNINKHYAFGIDDGSAPIDVPLHLLHALSGDTIVVEYVSGTVSALPGNFPYTDADGDTSYPADKGRHQQDGLYPGAYMTPYPIYLCELVGTFAKKNGEIIGQPFAIGDGPASFVVPVDARVLLLGVNDNKFSDNDGSWVISISKQKK